MKVTNVIVGAGISGITLAERLSSLGEEVLLIDKRNHIGGNCFDYHNEEGILVHKYGPHIFHTKNIEVWQYLSKFTDWNDYKHKVLASYKGKNYPMPINLTTINLFFNKHFDSLQAQGFIEQKKIKVDQIENSREVVISKVGLELYRAFIQDYTFKQWDCLPENLDREVLERLPVRFDTNDYYFDDSHQGMPSWGYTEMFKKMLNHQLIRMMLNTDYRGILNSLSYERLFVTSPIDEFFDFKFGKLPYRCIEFRFETLNQEEFQSNAVINYTELKPEFTRITEFKKLTWQKHPKTTICKEFPTWEGEPTYPVPKFENKELLKKYLEEAKKMNNVYFVGRLGTYSYLNMDQACNAALQIIKNLKLTTR